MVHSLARILKGRQHLQGTSIGPEPLETSQDDASGRAVGEDLQETRGGSLKPPFVPHAESPGEERALVTERSTDRL